MPTGAQQKSSGETAVVQPPLRPRTTTLLRKVDASFWPLLFSLIAVFLVLEVAPIDLWIQDICFDFERGGWRLDDSDVVANVVFYQGPKVLVGGVALVLFAGVVAPRRWMARLRFALSSRRACACALVTMVMLPLVIAALKEVTNTFFPRDIRRYGGDVPYVRVIEKFPDDDRPGRRGSCFPAAHASGGFSLVALISLARTRRMQVAFIAFACVLGTAGGVYQMLRGAHYFSHTVVTLGLAWLFCILGRRAFGLFRGET